MLPCEGSEALVQVAQRCCGYPWISGSVHGQLGWSSEQSHLTECIPAHGRALELHCL